MAASAPRRPSRRSALTRRDFVKRTGLGAAGYPGDAAVAECANAMQQIIGWSTERMDNEIAAVKRFYLIA